VIDEERDHRERDLDNGVGVEGLCPMKRFGTISTEPSDSREFQLDRRMEPIKGHAQWRDFVLAVLKLPVPDSSKQLGGWNRLRIRPMAELDTCSVVLSGSATISHYHVQAVVCVGALPAVIIFL
jgi:hypothetical protein